MGTCYVGAGGLRREGGRRLREEWERSLYEEALRKESAEATTPFGSGVVSNGFVGGHPLIAPTALSTRFDSITSLILPLIAFESIAAPIIRPLAALNRAKDTVLSIFMKFSSSYAM